MLWDKVRERKATGCEVSDVIGVRLGFLVSGGGEWFVELDWMDGRNVSGVVGLGFEVVSYLMWLNTFLLGKEFCLKIYR